MVVISKAELAEVVKQQNAYIQYLLQQVSVFDQSKLELKMQV